MSLSSLQVHTSLRRVHAETNYSAPPSTTPPHVSAACPRGQRAFQPATGLWPPLGTEAPFGTASTEGEGVRAAQRCPDAGNLWRHPARRHAPLTIRWLSPSPCHRPGGEGARTKAPTPPRSRRCQPARDGPRRPQARARLRSAPRACGEPAAATNSRTAGPGRDEPSRAAPPAVTGCPPVSRRPQSPQVTASCPVTAAARLPLR